MANSKYEYVKKFEKSDILLQNTWIVIRIDGRSFHKFSKDHLFEKPNDRRALDLMNECAKNVMLNLPGILLSYGNSDEYSFILSRSSNLYERRESKLVTAVVSTFSSNYVFRWSNFFPSMPLKYPPSFDGRAILYPTNQNLRDYLAWRQVDCHINNLYNTTFWTLVQKGELSPQEAEKRLAGTLAQEKHEILFSNFHINYNNEPEIFRKGSVIVTVEKGKCILHCDIIGNEFWNERPKLLELNTK